jgi:hypothetical protein
VQMTSCNSPCHVARRTAHGSEGWSTGSPAASSKTSRGRDLHMYSDPDEPAGQGRWGGASRQRPTSRPIYRPKDCLHRGQCRGHSMGSASMPRSSTNPMRTRPALQRSFGHSKLAMPWKVSPRWRCRARGFALKCLLGGTHAGASARGSLSSSCRRLTSVSNWPQPGQRGLTPTVTSPAPDVTAKAMAEDHGHCGISQV